ncbi:MAG: DUF2490 domain-containing protein [Flavobacteriales bacterium]|nr:DUF2490 domain-containing protein [Flavobacteriia bacterium]NCP05984.1 DUF2490 domain-containing protein [Flavobacteriales bacterium]PIV94117.1 MAG: hypothetical protein COW44_06070 [Flavobacteriaceae bacterium CG17_big_fil_post_rev_8_21_14_2_50_33_15]PIY09250.1 MAG: hypothetical protein COZ17_13695 [Flavobacteriaceae bacterium CG_4_10_14_3_um_filter_33_47]PJB17293.1 MAG: hypothetical protein CO117_12380 [Flavobacteriaceae bacterium CG_4_9_14_3_um_filter_33_16]
MKKLIGISTLLLSLNLSAQDLTNNLKSWNSVSVSYKIDSNFKAKFSQLFAFNLSPTNYSFSQTGIGLSYKIKKNIYIEGGYVRGLFNESNALRRQNATAGWFNTLAVDRVYGNFSYKHDIVKRVSLKHEFEFQYFFPDIEKFKSRSIYSARIAYNIRSSSVTPYLENQLFYYAGGTILSNGIKRNRIKLGLSFKPLKDVPVSTTLYYMYQDEFKTEPLSANDYSVVGLHLSFQIK